MRSLGYSFDRQEVDEWSFVRRISGDYPRYHAYTHLETSTLVINLHIDQKKPSYSGTRAHAGEYDGELVEREIARIRSFK